MPETVMSALSTVLLIYSFQSGLLFVHVGQPDGTAVGENLGRFLVQSIHVRGMTLNWLQWLKWKLDIRRGIIW